PSTEPSAPFEPTTIESDGEGLANKLDVEQLVDDPALLVVLRLGVHGPDVVVRAVEMVKGGEDRRPHRVVLVVVAVESVPSEGLQVLEPRDVAVDDSDGLAVRRVVHGIRLRDAHLDAVDDVGGLDESDARKLRSGQLDSIRIGHLPDVVALEAEVLDAEAGRS